MKQPPRALDPAAFIRHLYVAEDCLRLPYTQEILRRSALPVTILTEGEKPRLEGRYPANLGAGKRHLLLCRNKGNFFKPCPGTREYRCCGYQVLNIGMNCPMDCVYCILQAYLNNPWLSLFTNIEDLFTELTQALGAEPERIFRIGTGEFTDSLALDSLSRLSPKLIDFMRGQSNAVLELKTKSASIDHLKGLDHGGRTIVAWSLNSPQIMKGEEWRSASLEARLSAARQCADWGYRLAFHFDPLIIHAGWEDGYRHTIRALFALVPQDAIAWISLGGLRYLPALKQLASSRFPASRFFFHEAVDGLDGKRRYFRPERTRLYQFIVEELRRHVDARTCLYLCMESDEIWREVFGHIPAEQGGLSSMLDRSLHWL